MFETWKNALFYLPSLCWLGGAVIIRCVALSLSSTMEPWENKKKNLCYIFLVLEGDWQKTVNKIEKYTNTHDLH